MKHFAVLHADESVRVRVGAPAAPFISTVRCQLFVGLAFCILLPALVRDPLNLISGADLLRNTMFGSIAAFVGSFLFVRRFSYYPGVQSGAHILFAVSASFAIIVAVFFSLRIDYSRLMFGISYGLTLIWFVGINIRARGLVRPRLAIVPGGNALSLSALPGVEWYALSASAPVPEKVSAIVADLRHAHSQDYERLLADCALQGVPVLHSKDIFESLTGKVQVEHLSESTFSSLLPNAAYVKVREVLDWLLALAALPIFFALLFIIGPLILLDSGGPVFFAQTRVGYRGRSFRAYKFRTMRPSNSMQDGGERHAAITQDGDARVTKIGRVLRKYRIDEVPQILNILKGEMGWIGPRPEATALSSWYEAELPFYRYRHIVRPGLTGWAQVNQGHVASPDQVLEKLHYDFFYIKHLSPWLDMLIVLKTIRTVISGDGAK